MIENECHNASSRRVCAFKSDCLYPIFGRLIARPMFEHPCAPHTPRIDATHCYTADEFGPVHGAVCMHGIYAEQSPNRCNSWNSVGYFRLREISEPCADKFDPLPPCPPQAIEQVLNPNGQRVGLRVRSAFRDDEFWPELPARAVQP